MALQLISRPVGHKLSETQLSGTVYDDGTGTAVVNVPGGHSLSDGDYVYLETDIEDYNGFMYVDSTAYDYFKFKRNSADDAILFVQEVPVTFYVSVLEHAWQSVHLPIVYEIESDIFPHNIAEEEYVVRTVVSQANADGYTQINLSTALISPIELGYIQIIGGDMEGIYQVLDVLQPWSVVINLAYNASNSFTGGQVVRYYNNYVINVDVYSGLDPVNPWAYMKPYELAASLKLVPDDNGRVKFSVSEILKSYINTRNNLTLNTLPNNTDFHTSFYIVYSESYDQSDGTDVSTFTSTPVTENGDGNAVNSMMPFKSLNSGFMSDYLYAGGYLARWLTLFDRPVAVVGYFFDLSFLFNLYGVDALIRVSRRLAGAEVDTYDITLDNPGYGVLRVPLEIESGFDEYCVQAFSSPIIGTTWSQDPSGGTAWTADVSLGNPEVSLSSSAASKVLWFPVNLPSDYSYTVSLFIQRQVIGGTGTSTVTIYLLGNSGSLISSQTQAFTSSGTYSATLAAGNSRVKYIGLRVTRAAGTGTYVFDSFYPSIASNEYTEQICIDVIDECGATFNEDLRLVEAGPFRELE